MFISQSATLVALNVTGLVLSAYLVVQHYAGEGGGSQLCELGTHVSCARVLQSDWAVILGVPVAVHGVAYFVIATAFALLVIYGSKEFRNARDASIVMLAVCVVGLLSCVYFIVAEVMLGALCPLCTLVHMAVAASTYVAWGLFRERTLNSGWTFGVESLVEVSMLRIAWLLIAFSVAITPVIVFNLPSEAPMYSPPSLESFADCLTKQGVVFYGLASCSHCISQKALFAGAVKKLHYVECSGKDRPCEHLKIAGYPTWQRKDGKRIEGQTTLEKLSEFSSCNPPILLTTTAPGKKN